MLFRSNRSDITWHGVDPKVPDFSAKSTTLAFALDGRETGGEPDRDFYVACNASADPALFRIPASPTGKPWHRVVDTALPSPQDIVEEGADPLIASGSVYPVEAHSLIVLMTAP